jgi:hypothetical protein
MEGHSQPVFIASVLSLCLSVLAVSLRCFVRWKIVKYLGYDDILMLAAMVIS